MRKTCTFTSSANNTSNSNFTSIGNESPLVAGYPLTPSDSFSSFPLPLYKGPLNKIGNFTPMEAIRSRINQYSSLLHEDIKPFYTCDLTQLKNQLDLWFSVLPNVKPMYAIKCNPDMGFTQAIKDLGVGFDCASLGEIEQVRKLGTDDIIFANAIKSYGQISQAASMGVKLTTVDSIEEVGKIAKVGQGMHVLIRISTDDSQAVCPLSVKFGADLDYAKEILDECIKLGVVCDGIAFHLGSGFKDLSTIERAMKDSRDLWTYAEQRGVHMNLLDIGGGFSAEAEEFIPAGKKVNGELSRLFADEIARGQMNVIAELGRFLAAKCFKLVVNVNGVRRRNGKCRVYLNDGLYGNLNCILYDHQEVHPVVLTSFGTEIGVSAVVETETDTEYSIWGPTCDGLDCIKPKCKLTNDLDTGDWVMFENAGAYTSTAATSFNGFGNDFEVMYVMQG